MRLDLSRLLTLPKNYIMLAVTDKRSSLIQYEWTNLMIGSGPYLQNLGFCGSESQEQTSQLNTVWTMLTVGSGNHPQIID